MKDALFTQQSIFLSQQIVFISLHFLDIIMGHRRELRLSSPIQQVRQQAADDDERRPDPEERAGRAGLDEDLIGRRRERGREGPVDEEEHVPEGDAPPDHEVLHPREVVDRERQLAVDGPDHARVHVDPEDLEVEETAVAPEGPVGGGGGGEEEDDDGGDDPVEDPPENPRPAEEEVLDPLLV